MTDYLTTKELATLLRIKERKVYDLAASGRVPCSRAMGKLLFPRAEIEAWIVAEQTGAMPAKSRPVSSLPNVVVGSHDPLLEWALRESASGLAAYFDGSRDGLRRLEARDGLAAGLHVYDAADRDWNTKAVLGSCAGLPVVLMEWAKRQRGLIVKPSLMRRVRSIASVAGMTLALRQQDAGAQLLFEHLVVQAGLDPAKLKRAVLVRTETDAALAVLEGKADVSFGLQALAEQYRLGFVPIIEERFDLLVDRRSWFEPPMQALLNFCRSAVFLERAAEFPGFDISAFGTIHFNGP